MCPDEITVELFGDAKKGQGSREGKYVKQAGESNGYPYWLNGNQALWFSRGDWFVGSKSQLGGNSGGLMSIGARFCPTNLNWKFWYNGAWNIINKESAGNVMLI